MVLPFPGSFGHCARANEEFAFFFRPWMPSVCVKPPDSSSVQTFPFIHLLSGCRCQNWTRSHSGAPDRGNIVPCIPIPPRAPRCAPLLPPLLTQTYLVSYGHWRKMGKIENYSIKKFPIYLPVLCISVLQNVINYGTAFPGNPYPFFLVGSSHCPVEFPKWELYPLSNQIFLTGRGKAKTYELES